MYDILLNLKHLLKKLIHKSHLDSSVIFINVMFHSFSLHNRDILDYISDFLSLPGLINLGSCSRELYTLLSKDEKF